MCDLVINYSVVQTEQLRAELKDVLQTAVFDFSKEHRLMCAAGAGASGSPLVVKQGGVYKIMGLLNKGAAFPKMMLEGIIQKGRMDTDVEYHSNFVDLTLYCKWILEKIDSLSGYRI